MPRANRPVTDLPNTTRGQPGVQPVPKPVRPRPLKPRKRQKKSIPQPTGRE